MTVVGRPPILLERRDAVTAILRPRGDALVVSGLGSPTWDVAAAGDSPLNFYMWGAMGGAAMVGLGLAMSQPSRRVVVITGDGELLMGLGSLATIGADRTPNLSVVVLDNEHYGETGMQASHTARGVDLAGIARAAAFASGVRFVSSFSVIPCRANATGRRGRICVSLARSPSSFEAGTFTVSSGKSGLRM